MTYAGRGMQASATSLVLPDSFKIEGQLMTPWIIESVGHVAAVANPCAGFLRRYGPSERRTASLSQCALTTGSHTLVHLWARDRSRARGDSKRLLHGSGQHRHFLET